MTSNPEHTTDLASFIKAAYLIDEFARPPCIRRSALTRLLHREALWLKSRGTAMPQNNNDRLWLGQPSQKPIARQVDYETAAYLVYNNDGYLHNSVLNQSSRGLNLVTNHFIKPISPDYTLADRAANLMFN